MLVIHDFSFLPRLFYKSIQNIVQWQLLKFTIILFFNDAGIEFKLVMLYVFMFKEQSHNFYTLSCILEIILNLAIILIFQ